MSELLTIKNLHVTFKGKDKPDFHAIKGINLTINKNETVGIVGESGSGKSVTATSILDLLPGQTKVDADEMSFEGKSLLGLSQKDFQPIRGNDISMIFQDPLTTLNPVYTVENQIVETVRAHRKISKKEAKRLALEMLEKVGIKDAKRRIKMYPFEFSGGMRQRVMIAIALICSPKLLIADEPTTALDVTIQAQILRLLKSLQEETGSSIIMITHDLGVIWETCDRVIVMFKGHVVESGTVKQIYDHPVHPYTIGLMNSQINQETIKQKQLPTIPYGRFVNDMKSETQLKMTEVEPGHLVAEFSEEDIKQ